MILAALVLLVGCGEGLADELGTECQLAEPVLTAELSGPVDELLLVEAPGGFLALWSDASGSFLQALDSEGEPDGERRHLGPRCAAGMAVVSDETHPTTVGCLYSGAPTQAKPPGLLLVELDHDGGTRQRRFLAVADEGARDLSLARWGGALLVAWISQETSRGQLELRELSEWDGELSFPAILSRQQTTPLRGFLSKSTRSAIWTEQVMTDSGDTVGEIRFWSDETNGANTTSLSAVIEASPQPVLLELEDGRRIAAYRDEVRAGTKTRLLIAEINGAGESERPLVVGRADGRGPHGLLACGGSIFAVTPRSYGSSEALVSVWRLSEELEVDSPEKQIYTAGAEATHVAGVCSRDGLRIAVAELGRRGQHRIHSTTLRCSD